MLGDWLVVSQVLPVNPAAAVRGPKHVLTEGATPVLTPPGGRKLVASAVRGPKHVLTEGATPVLTPPGGRKLVASTDKGALVRAPRPGATLGRGALQASRG